MKDGEAVRLPTDMRKWKSLPKVGRYEYKGNASIPAWTLSP